MSPYEKLIAGEACRRLIAAGYKLTVDFERGYEASDARNIDSPDGIAKALAAMNEVDECHLMVSRKHMTFTRGETKGADHFVWFIWGNGNEGRDCISDYSTALSEQIDGLDEDWTNAQMTRAIAALDLLPDALTVLQGIATIRKPGDIIERLEKVII